MPSFYKLSVDFSCPSCHKMSNISAAIESLSSNRDEAAQVAGTLPLKCAACQKIAPAGTWIHVNVLPISANEYTEWIQAHQTSLHIHTDRKPAN